MRFTSICAPLKCRGIFSVNIEVKQLSSSLLGIHVLNLGASGNDGVRGLALVLLKVLVEQSGQLDES